MQENEIAGLLANQRAYYNEGHTLPVSARIAALKTLQSYIKTHEQDFLDALKTDLGKKK